MLFRANLSKGIATEAGPAHTVYGLLCPSLHKCSSRGQCCDGIAGSTTGENLKDNIESGFLLFCHLSYLTFQFYSKMSSKSLFLYKYIIYSKQSELLSMRPETQCVEREYLPIFQKYQESQNSHAFA